LSVACQPALGFVEAGLVAAFAVGVDGQVRDEFLEGAAVVWVPVEVVQRGRVDSSSLHGVDVVEDRDGVPVFGGPVAVPVLAFPQFGEAGLVVGVLDVFGGL
jgi:hypothetical protein